MKAYPANLTKSSGDIRQICARMRDHGAHLRAAIDTVDEAGDVDPADTLTAALRMADKDLRFMNDHPD